MLFLALTAAMAAEPVQSLDVPEGAPGILDTALPLYEALDPDVMVVGGEDASAKDWPGIAYVQGMFGACTGTLIHPKWVMTAAHCLPGVRYVMLNAEDKAIAEGAGAVGDAELIDVVGEFIAPTTDGRQGRPFQYDYDIALLELSAPAKTAPAVIARDCAIGDHLNKRARVAIVGWGATDERGAGPGARYLQEAVTRIDTPDCIEDQIDGIWTGCVESIRPGGEIGAGGEGIDACFGDSGGPLYLLTEFGTTLVGVTSRAYAGVSQSFPCRDGGIFVRPDAVVDWVEETIGEPLQRPSCSLPPDPLVDDIRVRPGGKARATIDPNDPDSDSFVVRILRQPLHGTAEIDKRGRLVVHADKDYEGADRVRIRVEDKGDPAWPDAAPGYADLTVPIEVARGCGGCATGSSTGLWVLPGLVGLLGLRRRR